MSAPPVVNIESAPTTSAANDVALLYCKKNNNCAQLEQQYREGYAAISSLLDQGVSPETVSLILNAENVAQSIIRAGTSNKVCVSDECVKKVGYLNGVAAGLAKITPAGMVVGFGMATYQLTTSIMNNGGFDTAVAIAKGISDLPANLVEGLNSADPKVRGEALVDSLTLSSVALAVGTKLGVKVLEGVGSGPAAGGMTAQRGVLGTGSSAANSSNFRLAAGYSVDESTGIVTGPGNGVNVATYRPVVGSLDVSGKQIYRASNGNFYTLAEDGSMRVPSPAAASGNGVQPPQFGQGLQFQSDALAARGVSPNTARINTTLSDGTPVTVIPDATVGGIHGTIIECKAVCNISNSNQLRGYAATGQPIELIVSPGNQSISAEVVRTIYTSGGSIKVYNPATGMFTPWKKP